MIENIPKTMKRCEKLPAQFKQKVAEFKKSQNPSPPPFGGSSSPTFQDTDWPMIEQSQSRK